MGYNKWEQLYNKRQKITLLKFEKNIKDFENTHTNSEYKKAILTYLAIWFDRIMLRCSSYGKWHYLQETVEHLFGRQSVSMSFDYPELNPFSLSSNGALGQLDFISRYINDESKIMFSSNVNNSASGDFDQFENKSIDAVITDPPYYDAIAYADISDYFYIWLKRILNDSFPNNFLYPQTPKSDECTALKHHHDNSKVLAKKHFENKLTEIFKAIEHQTSDIEVLCLPIKVRKLGLPYVIQS